MKSEKVNFQQYNNTYFRLFTLSYLRYLRRTQTVTPYPLHLNNVTALPCKMHNFFIWLKVCCIPPNVSGSEKSRLWRTCGSLVALKRTGCDVRQMECQASNVTANVQSDHLLHGYMLPVFFATDQLHIDYHALLKFRPSCIAHWCSIRVKMRKIKNLCTLQGSAVTFSGVAGKGVTVCFLLR